MTHLTFDQKNVLLAEFTRALSAAVLPILQREHAKGSCLDCVSRSLVGALAERTGTAAATAALGQPNTDQEQFMVGVLVAAAFAVQLKKDHATAGQSADPTDADLAAMPTSGRPS